jgi:hypothetical protein
MCDLVERAYALALSRRAFLGHSSLVAGGLAAGVSASPAAAGGRRARSRQGASSARGYRSRLVLLGTAAGPVW